MPSRLSVLLTAIVQMTLLAVLVPALARSPEPRHHQQVTLAEVPTAPVVQEPHAVRAPVSLPRLQRVTASQHAPSRPAPRRTAGLSVQRRVTFQERMMRAVHRIPGYRDGVTRWRASGRYGHWGASDVYHHVIYIAPWVPQGKLYSVVVHEWGHMLTVQAYDGDVRAAFAAMNDFYGGTGWAGGERAADCIARVLGADWTNYTSCTRTSWRTAARRLIAGERLQGT